MKGPIPVTVVVPVKNEERNLGGCLSRLGRFANVLVVDSASEDRTGEIAADHGAKLLQFRWTGSYPKKRNWVLMHHNFTTDWVLFLDADELLDDVFCDALEHELRDSEKVGYWLNYTNYFLGQKLRHGVPQRKLALLRVGAGLYEYIEEEAWSGLDMEIHEHPVLNGPVGEISAPIDHRDFRGVAKFLTRHIEYAKWEAARYERLRTDSVDRTPHLSDRQKFKYIHINKWWYPSVYFIGAYGFRFGFLDGRAGLAYAFYKAWYFQTIRALLAEHHMSANEAWKS